MRWGVCCDDLRVADWLQQLARSADVPAFLGVRRSPLDDALFQGIPRVEFCDNWQSLLIARNLDGILVGGRDDEAFTAMRQLAQSSIPLYVRPHSAQGLSLAYELTLIAAERDAPIRPLWPHRADPALAAIKRWLTETGRGLQHIELERTVNVADVAEEHVDENLATLQLDDADIVRWLGIRGSRLTALRTSRPEPKHRRFSVTLETDGAPVALWTAETRSGGPTHARLTLQLASGLMVLEQHDGEPWALTSGDGGALASAAEPMWIDPDATWDDAVAVFEWIDAVERSLERRRAIELHSEPLSERTIFKTQMAAAGCAVLLGTLALSLVYLGVASIVPLPQWLLLTLRTVIFAPLFVFLLAQLLLPLTRSARPAA